MKIFLIVFLNVFFITKPNAQLFFTNNGRVSFFSKTVVKDIFAESKTASAILNLKTNEIAVRISNASFVFENNLMQEHFNEKYMESEKFPVSTFAGKLNDKINIEKLGEYETLITGKFLIHGVEKTETLKAKIVIEKNNIGIKGIFKVRLNDYKITKPSLVMKEIADEMEIKTDLLLQKK